MLLLVALLAVFVPAGAQGAEAVIANGDSPTADLSPVGDVDTWSFTAGVGDALFLQIGVLSGTDFQPVLELLDPNSLSVASASGTASADLFHQALVAGEYTVNVSDTTSDGTGTYQLYLGRIPGSFVVPAGDEGGVLGQAGAPITDVQSGDIDLGDLDIWTYEADELDTVIVQIGEVGDTAFRPFILLYGPDGSFITSNQGAVSADLSHQATVAGTYTVVVKDGNFDVTGTGSYDLYFANVPRFTASAPGEEGGPLVNGGSHLGTIDLGDIDLWSFVADELDTVIVQIGEVGDTAFDPFILLYGPDGSFITSNQGAVSADLTHQVTVAGTYTLVVKDGNFDVTGSGSYDLYFTNVRDFLPPAIDDGGPLSNGDLHPGSIDLGDVDLWRTDARAMDTLIVQIAEVGATSFVPFILLYGPDGTLITSNSGGSSADLTHQATVAGEYTVVVKDDNFDVTGAGSYNLYFAGIPGGFVVPTGDEGGGLTNGDLHSGSIDLGDVDIWTTQANELETLIVQIAEVGATSFVPFILLYGPDGTLITSNSGASSANLTHQTTVAGTYTVVVKDDNFDVTGAGSYNLYLGRVPGGFTVPSGDEGGALASGSPVSGDIDLADLDLWSFDLDALDTAMLDITEVATTAFDPFIRLYAPNGDLVASDVGAVTASLTHQASVAGTYTVVAQDGNLDVTGVGDYQLTLTLTPDSSAPPAGAPISSLVNGGVVNGDLDPATEVDLYDLPVSAGDQVRLQLGDTAINSFVSPMLEVFTAGGSLLASDSSTTLARVSFMAPSTETLRLVVTNASSGTGPYALFTAIAPGAFTTPSGDEGGVLANGDVASGSWTLGDIDLYSLSVVVGDQVRLQLGDTSNGSFVSPVLEVFAADGSPLASDSSTTLARVSFTAPSTETLTVMAYNGSTADGTYDLFTGIAPGAFTTPSGDEGGVLANGDVASGSWTLGDLDLYSLSVVAGDQVRLQLGDTSNGSFVSPVLQVFAADGTRVVSHSQATLARVSFTASNTETLTVVAYNGSTADGTYDLFTAIAPGAFTTPSGDEGGVLANGDVASGSWTLGDIDLYSLSVVVGDQVRLQLGDTSNGSFVSPVLEVFAADGSPLASDSSTTLARVSFTAPSTETLTVMAYNGSTADGTYDLFTGIAPGAFTTPSGDEGGVLANGDVASGSWTLGDIDLYSLSVVVGDHVRLQLGDTSNGSFVSPVLQVFAADGSRVASDAQATLARVSFTASSTETLTVVAYNGSTADGTYDLFTAVARGAFVTPGGDEGGALTSGVTANGVFTLGDIDLYSFTVLAGDAVAVSLTDAAAGSFFSPVLEVYTAEGSRIVADSSTSTASVAFTASRSETLRLVAYNSSTGEGPYELLANVVTPLDSDGDGLSDEAEIEIGTSISETDTDGDGVSDFDEVNFDGDPDYNPLLDLDPLDVDTDGDGFTDGEELAAGSDPLDPASVPALLVPSLTAAGYLVLVGAMLVASFGPLRRRRRDG